MVIIVLLSGSAVAYAYRDHLPFAKKAVTTTIEVAKNSNTDDQPTDSATPITDVAGDEAQISTGSTADQVAWTPGDTTSSDIGTPATDPVTWNTPEKLTDLKLFKENLNDSYRVAQADYYKVGTPTGGGEVITIFGYGEGPGPTQFLRVRKDSNGQYYYLPRSSVLTDRDQEHLKAQFVDTVKVDDTTAYASLVIPSKITLDEKTSFSLSSSHFGSGNSYFFSDFGKEDFLKQTPVEISETKYGTLYKVAGNNAAEVLNRRILLRLSDQTLVDYTLDVPFATDDKVYSFTLNNGDRNQAKFASATYQCGSPQTSVIKNAATISDRLSKIGAAANGDSIYGFKAATDPALTELYNNYATGREGVASQNDFFVKNALIVWQDPLKDYQVFMKEDYAPLGECGKPAIYLYPTAKTSVSVKVAANITKSEPDYGSGWNVVANPSGAIELAGKGYPYLYWDGFGLGKYPLISSGSIVKRNEVEAVLKSQLAQQGLTEKESADFLEFWLPKMPNTPYVRLTWLGTKEMNQLAPLSISPKPDTLIRVFLDYQGLMEPMSLASQNLRSIPRTGFTVVEWGGLLRN